MAASRSIGDGAPVADDKQKPSRGSGKKAASAPQPGGAAAAPDAAQPFPIVGIGASAGGLKALEAFFAAMPRNDDVTMAFVVVQHLAPDHKSLLVELVRRYTRMQVVEAENQMHGRAQLRVHHPAEPRPDDQGRQAVARRAAGPRAAPDDRPLLPLARRRAARTRDLHRHVGHRQRRHARPARDQGRGRHGDRPGAGHDRVRRHAAQRDRHRPGGLTCCRLPRCRRSCWPTRATRSSTTGPGEAPQLRDGDAC